MMKSKIFHCVLSITVGLNLFILALSSPLRMAHNKCRCDLLILFQNVLTECGRHAAGGILIKVCLIRVRQLLFPFSVPKLSSLLSKHGKPLLNTNTCTCKVNIFFVPTPQNIDFAH